MTKFCGKSDDGHVGIVFTPEEWASLTTLITLSADLGQYGRLLRYKKHENMIQSIYDDLCDQNSELMNYIDEEQI